MGHGNMVLMKLKAENPLRKIPATSATMAGDQLVVRDGDTIVGEFPLDQIEHWFFWQPSDPPSGTLTPRSKTRKTEGRMVHVKLRHDEEVKRIKATNAGEVGDQLIVTDGERVVGRFLLEQIEHWYVGERQGDANWKHEPKQE